MSDLAGAMNRLTDLVEEELRRRERVRRDEERSSREERHAGRRPLRRMGLRAYLEAVPGFAGRFSRRVPDEMVAAVDEHLVEVACPCGEGHSVGFESLVVASCGRAFVWDGRRVWVAPAASS